MKDEYDEANALRERLEAAEANKDGAYLERNKLVALLSTLFSSGKKKTAIEGWSEDWHGCVFIDFPWGQASWHYHDSHAHLFRHLPEYAGNWNGHTTEEKYAAIDAAIGREGVREMSRCPDCKNEFVQPFVCTTCGAEKLYDATVVTLQNQLAAAQDEIKRLRGKCAAIEGNEIGYPCVALSEALSQRDNEIQKRKEISEAIVKLFKYLRPWLTDECQKLVDAAIQECGK